MRMLLIGDPNSPWIINFLQNYLMPHGIQVTIFTDLELEKRNISFYIDNDIEVIECLHKKFFKRKCTKLGYWLNLLRHGIKQKGFENYDIINIQYVDLTLLIWSVMIAKFPQKITISYWGSDLLRKKRCILRAVLPFIKKVGKYTFDNVDLYNFFVKLYGEKLQDRCRVALFGLPILNTMKEKLEVYGRNGIRQKHGFSDSDIVIAIGYNGKQEQQHLKVLQELYKLNEQVKQNIIIVIQMTYGGEKDYRSIVKETAMKTGCVVRVYENFLDDNEVAELRCITDIYINSQTTDAFSGSVCEYLYGGTCLVNAKWLRYAEFDKYPFQFLEYEDFSDLSEIIQEIIEKKYILNSDINKRLIWQLRSWECCEKKWSNIF